MELQEALLKIWKDGSQWAYCFCDYELLCMYDENNIIAKYSEEEVIKVSRELRHPVVEFEGLNYFSSVECSQDTLLEMCKEAQEEGNL